MNKKIKTILFGAGVYGERFINLDKTQREYIVAVDNDTKKHNTDFNGMNIISPNDIEKYQYDEIIITSYWEHSIKKQLIEELNVDPTKIVTMSKNLLKDTQEPFKDSATLKLAREMIVKLCGNAFKQDLPLHIDYGTLIGIMRDNDIIEWDDDIDLAIEEKFQEQLELFLINEIKEINKSIDFTLIKHTGNGVVMSYIIKCVSKHYKEFTIDICLKQIKDGYAEQLSSLGQWKNPAHCVEKLDSIIWQNTKIFIPSDHDTYLTYTYGDWKTPIKNLTFTDGYNPDNLIEIPAEDFLNTEFINTTLI